jgi:hypothetical protein
MIFTRFWRNFGLVAFAAGPISCGSSSEPMRTYVDAGSDAGNEAALADQIVALEGQERFLTGFRAPGLDLSRATLTADDVEGPLEIRRFQCNRERCAAEIRVRDTVPPTGNATPVPADARNAFVRISTAAGQTRLGLVSVWPIDNLVVPEDEVISTRGVKLATTIDVGPNALINGASTTDPVRWFIVGGGRFGGTIDANGPIAFVALGAINMTGAAFVSGDLETNGNVALIAPSWTGTPRIDVVLSGASAGAIDGLVTDDQIRVERSNTSVGGVEIATSTVQANQLAPCVDMREFESIVDTAQTQLRGLAAPSGRVIVTRKDDEMAFETTADAAGTFEVTVELVPGVNRLRVEGLDGRDERVRGFCGTAFDFVGREPVGAFIDIAYVPTDE